MAHNDDTIASLSELGNEKDVADPIKGFPNVSAARLEAALNTEFLSLKSGYDTAKTRRMTFWREYRFQPYGNERPGASSVVDSTIFNAIEWMLPVLIQPFVETAEFVKVQPNSGDIKDIIVAEVFRELLSVQIRERMPWYQVLYDTWKGALVQGESYVKVTWVKKGKNEPVSRPEVVAIPASRIRYDWTVQNFMDSHVVTEEVDHTRSKLLKAMKGAKNLMDERFVAMMSVPGSNEATSRLRDEKFEQPNWVGEDNTKSSVSQTLYNRREHWTEYDMDGSGIATPILAVFINDTLVQVIANPFDFQRPPYLAAQDARDPLGNPAFGHAEMLRDVQKYRTAILRMMSDNLNAQHNGLYEMDMNNVDDVARILLENAPPGSKTALPVRKPGSIVPVPALPIAPQAFTAWEIQAEVGENRSGFTRYSQGLDSKGLNQTATGITQIMQRSDMRMWELAQRFAEMFIKPLTRMLISMNQQFLDDQSIRLQFGLSAIETPEGASFQGLNPGQWLTLNKKDIGGVFSVTIDVDVASDKQQKIDNWLQYLQFTGPFIGQGVPKEVISVVAVELAKAMGLNKVQSVMRNSYVGAAGVSIPANSFSGAGEGQIGATQSVGAAVEAAPTGAGVQGAGLEDVLGQLAGTGAAGAPGA